MGTINNEKISSHILYIPQVVIKNSKVVLLQYSADHKKHPLMLYMFATWGIKMK